jgi:hypothetical protein
MFIRCDQQHTICDGEASQRESYYMVSVAKVKHALQVVVRDTCHADS